MNKILDILSVLIISAFILAGAGLLAVAVWVFFQDLPKNLFCFGFASLATVGLVSVLQWAFDRVAQSAEKKLKRKDKWQT